MHDMKSTHRNTNILEMGSIVCVIAVARWSAPQTCRHSHFQISLAQFSPQLLHITGNTIVISEHSHRTPFSANEQCYVSKRIFQSLILPPDKVSLILRLLYRNRAAGKFSTCLYLMTNRTGAICTLQVDHPIQIPVPSPNSQRIEGSVKLQALGIYLALSIGRKSPIDLYSTHSTYCRSVTFDNLNSCLAPKTFHSWIAYASLLAWVVRQRCISSLTWLILEMQILAHQCIVWYRVASIWKLWDRLFPVQ